MIVICKPCSEPLAIQLSCLSSANLQSPAGIRASDGDIAETTTGKPQGTMKKIRLKYAIQGFNETLYEVNVGVCHQEEVVIDTPPRISSPQIPSEAQKTQRMLFAQAVVYTKAAMADPEVSAYYLAVAQRQGKSPRSVAFSDYCKGNNLLAKK